jgi:protein-tyrosine phosphatase
MTRDRYDPPPLENEVYLLTEVSDDYIKGCVNFRDVGKSLRLVADKPLLPEGRLLRGGQTDFVARPIEVGLPRTVINLRKDPDSASPGARTLHFPISNNYGKYETQNPEVRLWLNRVVSAFADAEIEYPVLVHCFSGKDRTGVVVAALLRILNVPDEFIVNEYLLSEGEVREEWIRAALDGIGDSSRYFKGVNIKAVVANLTSDDRLMRRR